MPCRGTNVSYAANNTLTSVSTPRLFPCNDMTDPLNCPKFLSTPKVLTAARDFFDCPTLPGMELENQESSCFLVGECAGSWRWQALCCVMVRRWAAVYTM